MKKKVLITATGGRSVGSGILHALLRANSEVRDRWDVLASDANPFAWGLYKANKGLLLPLASDESYLDVLLDEVRKSKIDAIIPGSEPEAMLLSNAPSISNECKIIGNTADLMPYMKDKVLLDQKLKEVGINHIPTFLSEEVNDAVEKYGFPLVCKPAQGTGGSRGLKLICDQEELDTLLADQSLSKFACFQPYLGDAESEYTVGVVNDKDGNLIDSIVMKRKLMGLSLLTSSKIEDTEYAISTGYSQGFIVDHPALQAFCEGVAKTFKSVGPLNLQVREHNNEFYIFDFHPRFSGTTPIRADVGFHEVDLLLRNHLFDEHFGRLNYQRNVAAIRAFEHVIVPIDEMLKKPN